MVASAPTQLKRSCFRCQKKKQRCDRKDRCSNCTKHNAQCTYPGVFSTQGNRSNRHARSLASFASRLEKLERILTGECSDSDASNDASQTAASESFASPKRSVQRGSLASNPQKASQKLPGFTHSERPKHQNEHGMLLETRRSLVSDDVPPQKASLSPQSSPDATNRFCAGMFFQTQSAPNSESLELSPAHKTELWTIFKMNVDPLIKILHLPSTQHLFYTNHESPRSILPEIDALVNAICFAAVVSLDADMCRMRLGHEKETMIVHLRSSVESALSKASFLITEKIEVHQAFAIYLICLRSQKDSNLVCKLVRIALGLARSQGFHRDGSNLGLRPFETEMRRRLWWLLVCLDTRCSEEDENSPVLAVYLEDTQLPLNINDSDLMPEMTTWPEPRSGCTDMTLSLIKLELISTWRQLRLSACIQSYAATAEAQNLHHQRELINNCQKIITQKYLAVPDCTAFPNFQQDIGTSGNSYIIYHLSRVIFQLLLAKMWLTVHSAPTSQPIDQESDTADQGQLLDVSTRILELSNSLCQNEATAHWSWLYRTFVPWHATTFVLTELCRRQPDDSTRRAWRAVDAILDAKTLQTAESQGYNIAYTTRKLREEALAQRIRQSLKPGQ